MKLIRALLLTASLAASASAQIQWDHDDECPPNEFWADASSCNPVYYQPSCGNDKCDFVNPGNCMDVCWINRCFCNPGFKRDCRGRCIPADMCSCPCTACPANEEWSNCANAQCYGCPQRCPITPNVCTGGCVCKNGYYRSGKSCVQCTQSG